MTRAYLSSLVNEIFCHSIDFMISTKQLQENSEKLLVRVLNDSQVEAVVQQAAARAFAFTQRQ